MPRRCTICDHDESHAINVALVQREPYRAVARQYGVSKDALQRHSQDHIPQLLVEAKHAVEVSEADDLLARVEDLEERTIAILDKAEEAGELRTALSAIREARGNVELLAKLRGELDERPVINVNTIVNSEVFIALQARLVDALEPFPAAGEAYRTVLEELSNGRG
jgi:hypothetical protein